MPESSPRVLIIDDLESVRTGLADLISRLHPGVKVTTMDFDEVLASEAKDFRFDYAIIDLSRPSETDDLSEYPCWSVIPRVRFRSDGRGPWMIVVTGESAAFAEPLTHRMLEELEVDFYLLRTSLEAQLASIFSGVDRNSRPHLSEPRLKERSRTVVEELGVNAQSKLQALYDYLLKTDIQKFTGKRGAAAYDARLSANAIGGLDGRNRDGNPTPTDRGPSGDQFRRLMDRLTRLPRPGRR